MRDLATRLMGAATMAVLATTLIGGAVSAASSTSWVDDDGSAGPSGCDGPRNASISIQGAIDAAGPDTTIRVCPGTYDEQLVITGDRHGLTLRSEEPWQAIIRTPADMAEPFGFNGLIMIDQVDRVTIQGFRTKARTQAPCEDVYSLLVASGSRRTVIRGNRFLTDSRPGDDCRTRDAITIQDQPMDFGAFRSGSATISNNMIRDAERNSILAYAVEKHVTVDIYDNSLRAYGQGDINSPTGIALAPIESGFDTGISISGDLSGRIAQNVIQGGSSSTVGARFGTGIKLSLDSSTDQPLRVQDNTIRRVDVGVFATWSGAVQVLTNRITNTFVGIELDRTADSLIRSNTVGSSVVGIRLDDESADDRVVGNWVTGSGGRCVDASTGSRTAGTANHWSGNAATKASHPAAICEVVH